MRPVAIAVRAIAALLLIGGISPAGAQGLNGPKLKVSAAASVDAARPGDTFQIAVVLDLPEKVHVNAHEPSEEYLIATEVRFTAPSGFTVGEVAYPESKEIRFSFTDKPVAVYEGQVVFRAPVTVGKAVQEGTAVIPGVLSAQPCDDETCFPPTEVPFKLSLPVVAAGATVKPANAALFAGTGASPATPAETPTPATAADNEGARYPHLNTVVTPAEFLAWLEKAKAAGAESESGAGRLGDLLRGGNWLLALPLIFLAGLALNLTPCVYPVIPITISYFGGQSSGSRGRVVTLAALYVLGMATMYSALGTAVALGGQLFGSQLQNPYVLAGFAVVMVALGLSMFGVWEMRLPASLTSRVSGRAGYAGAFLMGMLVGVVAAPCVGPAVIALLEVVAHLRNPVLGFAIFFSLALGLGVPYLVLGSFSGLIQKLPRSGEWMNAVKHVFGLILFGMGLYYLGPLIGPAHGTLMSVYTILAGLYLLLIDNAGRSARRFFAAKRGIGAAATAVALWMVVPRGAPPREEFAFEPYSEARVLEAVAKGTPVLIDFRAEWCAQCKELEATVFSDPEVIDQLREMVVLQKDLTRWEDAEAAELRRVYNIRGLPHVVLIPPGAEAPQ